MIASLAALVGTAVVSAQTYAGRPEYGEPGKGYVAVLTEIEARAGPSDGIITIAPYHYQVPMARYRGHLPIYGYAAQPMPLHRETESVLTRALSQHPAVWLVTVGLSPADPANGVERWLAEHAFKSEDHWMDDARLVAFVSAAGLEPLATQARLGDRVRLIGVQVSRRTLRPGDTLAVELTWQAEAPAGDLRGFVQLLSADGQLVAGQDGVPGGGYTPTTEWQSGIPVVDHRGLVLPAQLAPGEYQLIAGLYDPAGGSPTGIKRLPVTNVDGNPGGDFVRLGTVQVR
jgi:hypothetical protein